MRIPAILLALLVAVSVMVPLQPLRAQAPVPAQSRYLAEDDHRADTQAAFIHFATRFTEVISLGLLGGGLLMNRLVGGSIATMVGTFSGALVASWLYLDQVSSSYVVREIH